MRNSQKSGYKEKLWQEYTELKLDIKANGFVLCDAIPPAHIEMALSKLTQAVLHLSQSNASRAEDSAHTADYFLHKVTKAQIDAELAELHDHYLYALWLFNL
jgi:hypothetical protein